MQSTDGVAFKDSQEDICFISIAQNTVMRHQCIPGTHENFRFTKRLTFEGQFNCSMEM